MTPLRVMQANGTLFGGGAEHVIGTLARQLRLAGHEVSVAVIGDGGEVRDDLRAEGFDVETGVAGGARGLAAARRLAAAARARDAQIVHTHDPRSLMDAGLARRLRLHPFRHVHTFHFGNYPHLPGKVLAVERLCARLADRLVAVGHEQRAQVAEALWLGDARLTTIWNGVDAQPHPVGTVDAPADTPVVGSMSTFGVQKGLPVLIDAAALLRDSGRPFRLVLVGDGSLRPELEAQVRRLALDDRVTFTGWRADAATSLLPRFDVFVQSSNWEAMSVVILEAMAAARPIVATTVGENVRVLEHEVSALLVPPRDPHALATALGRVLDDPCLRDTLGRRAQARYQAEFTGLAMAARYMSLYRTILGESSQFG